MIELTENSLLLGIDTCGARGTIAVARMEGVLSGGGARLLGESELPERNAAAAIVSALDELLRRAAVGREEIGVIVVVNGPGSFTGVRIGVSTALGLSAGVGARVVGLSRLEVLAAQGGALNAAFDAHRGEVYLRAGGHESLANEEELQRAGLTGARVAVCEDAAAELMKRAAPGCELAGCAEPTAALAIEFALARISGGEFTDPMALDGNYLRRSDAEIFWKRAKTTG